MTMPITIRYVINSKFSNLVLNLKIYNFYGSNMFSIRYSLQKECIAILCCGLTKIFRVKGYMLMRRAMLQITLSHFYWSSSTRVTRKVYSRSEEQQSPLPSTSNSITRRCSQQLRHILLLSWT